MDISLAPGSVVVGVDGSAGSDVAVRWACAHAETQRRPLAIVHGCGSLVLSDVGYGVAEARDAVAAAGERIVTDAAAVARATSPDLRVTTCVALEDPRRLLMSLGGEASVLVLGARGHGRLAGLLLGSVSAAVSGHAPGPVVVARELPWVLDQSGESDPAGLPVVVGVDGTDASAGAVAFAFELASETGRPLHVVHAVGDLPAYPYLDVLSPDQLREIEELCRLRVAESLAGFGEKYPDVPVDTTLSLRSPAAALRHASETAYAVVVGTRGRGPVARRLLGSVSSSVVQVARCTVAVVPGDAA